MVGTIGNKAFNATDINAQFRLGVFLRWPGELALAPFFCIVSCLFCPD